MSGQSKKFGVGRRAALWAAPIAAALIAAAAPGCNGTGCSAQRVSTTPTATSDHFDGALFRNLDGDRQDRALDAFYYLLTKKEGEWADWTDDAPGPAPPERVGPGELRAVFVGHATVLLQADGQNILTDPVWSGQVGPFSWAGRNRRRPPGLRFEDLPPIDAVLISHDHYDHLDLPTLVRLDEAFGPLFFVPLGVGELLADAGIERIVELDWRQSAEIGGGVRIDFAPARHFSRRGVFDGNESLWGGYVVETSGGPVYFAGDTGFGEHFAEIAARFGPMRLSLLPIGAFLPRWFLAPMHLSPPEAVEVHRLLKSAVSIPIHYGTFRQGEDGQHEPVELLRETLAEQGIGADEFVVLPHGQALEVKARPPYWPEGATAPIAAAP